MKGNRLIAVLLSLLVTVASVAAAQEIDLGPDVTGYRRFLIYPHLQRGLESMQRGERDRSIGEFTRARELAPENGVLALYLAQAYQTFGDIGHAESVLREQLTHTPQDARVRAALTALRPGPNRPAAPAQRADGVSRPAQPEGSSRTADANTRPEGAAAQAGQVNAVGSSASRRSGPSAPPTTGIAAGAATSSRTHPPVATTARSASPAPHEPSATTAPVDPRARFVQALGAQRFDEAQQDAMAALAQAPGDPSLLDELTFQLADAGASSQAMRVLLSAYPFSGATADQRDAMFQRLAVIVSELGDRADRDELVGVRRPLDTAALRSRQAAMWAGLKECDVVRAVLADLSPDYSHDDWMRLGSCSEASAPGMAQEAYARAHALRPGGPGSRALGYQAYATGDFDTALSAWRSVTVEELSNEELLGAVTTAFAAGDANQAALWLTAYERRGGPEDHRYLSLTGQRYIESDKTRAAVALSRAMAAGGTVDDYRMLARIEGNPDRQFTLLAQAAELDPTNMTIQLELGYAAWRAGRFADSRAALERAWRSDPANVVAAQQLVYVNQRLHRNDDAREFAERVLNVMPATGAERDRELANRRFGLQRLHEDLGRRLTINLDGWSGTRVGTGTSGSQAGSRYRSYSQLEADVRLGRPSIRDGKTISAYARVIADGDQRSALPSENPWLGVGLRWKPLRSQVFYLAAEQQTALEGAPRREWLLRASASLLNGGRFGDDWHPGGGQWFAQNLYLDAAHYVNNELSATTADYRTSVHQKIAASQTLEPYAHLQISGMRKTDIQRDVRGGAGVRWNVWYGGNRYNAAPHKLSFGVEVQQAFDTYLPDRHGVFATLSSRW